MPSTIKCEVLIAGAGPAGLASALYLLRHNPSLRGRVVALDKARHPRFKVCAGGLIPKTMLALRELSLDLDVPAIEVMRGTARTPAGEVDMFRGDPLCTVIRRDLFDARLARAASEAGLEIVENCRVLHVEQGADSVRVTSDRGCFEAPVLIGADGSGSRVRSSIFGRDKDAIGRALMIDIAVDPERTAEFVERRYIFDFRCVPAGVHGYAWSFPCLVGSRPHLNLGIYEQHPPHGSSHGERSPLLDRLRALFPELDREDLGRRATNFHAFPIRWFDRGARFAAGRVMLAGDAAGVDPLMGEGISCAFEHGKLAAQAVSDLVRGDADAIARYDDELHRGSIGRKLRRLSFAARRFYGPRHRLYFRLACANRRAQQIGVDWFNGAAHTDELPVPTLVARWLKAVLLDSPVR